LSSTRRWAIVLIVLCALWIALMVAASYWGYVHRDPVRIEPVTSDTR